DKMNIIELKHEFPQLKTVIAVSKTRTAEEIKRLIDAGFRDFGENKAQELAEKAPFLDGIVWHFIGHLQTNKVKEVLAIADFIHSVDSIKLLDTIEKEAKKQNKKINILMQVNLANEETKFGMERSEIPAFLEAAKKCAFAQLTGIMVIGPHTDDEQEIRKVFQEAKLLQTSIQKNIPAFQECSMGMSADYRIALEEGATMIRIGTLLFGPR
ncbi:MAG: YggS family pyridoxal phosphate-dependent enzyme, partial [Erysipelotrichaceae bacterium]